MEKKEEAVKLEGLQVAGKKKSNNLNKEIEKVYTSPIKIGNQEYIIKPLSMLDIKKLNIERGKIKKDDEIATYDYGFYTLLAVIKKWNPEAKDMKLDEFEELVPVSEFEDIQDAIMQLAGLKKLFKLGDSKK